MIKVKEQKLDAAAADSSEMKRKVAEQQARMAMLEQQVRAAHVRNCGCRERVRIVSCSFVLDASE